MDDINKKAFSRMVENFVFTHRGTSYMDAIVELCEQNEIDPRDAKKLVSKDIIERLEFEARELNLLIGGNTSHTLPVDI